ncbi:MAG: DUF4249 family protein [Bacteroidales bacterium]|nr:DUF4249 family protein [Bacteroidales bacterium]
MKTRIILLILLMAASACETRIDLGDDGLGDVLMMNAQMCTTDTTHTVWLSRSARNSISFVDDAIVSCYVNDELVCVTSVVEKTDDVSLTGKDKELCASGYVIRTTFSPGDKVRIKADCDNLQCEANIIVPKIPVLLEAKANICTTPAEYRNGTHRFKVHIQDFKDEYNYYCLRVLDHSFVEVGYSSTGEYEPGDILLRQNNPLPINSRGEPVLNSGARTIGNQSTSDDGYDGNSYFDNKENIFTDVLFRNGDYTLDFYIDKIFSLWPPGGFSSEDVFTAYHKATVRLFNITREEYLYLSGYQFINSDENGTYFTGDFVFPSNVEGGLGFVTINSAVDYTIDISKRVFDKEYFGFTTE